MVKIFEDKYPKGTFSGQRTDGIHMDLYLKENLDIMAKRIKKDMQFVGIVSGNGTVRNGKSTIAQQIGAYFTEKVNQLHETKNTFAVENIVFKAKQLTELAFRLPKYSVIVLDEGDDLTAQYYTKLAVDLRRFFRKCGQLNLFLILLIPDFFELPRTYAVIRSTFLVNVKFEGEFERGFFNFYSTKRKRDLYYQGKKYGNYEMVKPDFYGRFPKPYMVDEKAYKDLKLKDMMSDEAGGEDLKNRISKEDLKYILWRIKRYADAKTEKVLTYEKMGLAGAKDRTLSVEDMAYVFQLNIKTVKNYINSFETETIMNSTRSSEKETLYKKAGENFEKSMEKKLEKAAENAKANSKKNIKKNKLIDVKINAAKHSEFLSSPVSSAII